MWFAVIQRIMEFKGFFDNVLASETWGTQDYEVGDDGFCHYFFIVLHCSINSEERLKTWVLRVSTLKTAPFFFFFFLLLKSREVWCTHVCVWNCQLLCLSLCVPNCQMPTFFAALGVWRFCRMNQPSGVCSGQVEKNSLM